MREFAETRRLADADRRIALARGSPGLALSLDLEVYDRRREAMLTLLEVAAGLAPFSAWVKYAESSASRQEKLDTLLRILYGLLEDVLVLERGGNGIRNTDVRPQLDALAGRVSFTWIREAVAKVDELAGLVRRNIQKNIALDALIAGLRPSA
jgi:DNA polymerase-3 subunit delta'